MHTDKHTLKKPIRTKLPLTVLTMVLAAFIAGCSTMQVASRWRHPDVATHEKNFGELDSMVTLEDKRVLVSLMNDQQFLYIKLMTSDQDVQRMFLRKGLFFWFDHNGGKEKAFGIHFPIGFQRQGPQHDEPDGREDRTEMVARQNFESTDNELEICGPGEEERHRMTIAETQGVAATHQVAHGVLACELKIPLADNGVHPFAIGTRPGSIVGIGIESSPSRIAPRASEGFPPDGGERGEGGSRPGGEFGGRGRGGHASQEFRSGSGKTITPLSVWAKATLAQQNSR